MSIHACTSGMALCVWTETVCSQCCSEEEPSSHEGH